MQHHDRNEFSQTNGTVPAPSRLGWNPTSTPVPDFGVSFYQVEDRDEWVWTMDIMGVVKLRYGIEVSGKYL